MNPFAAKSPAYATVHQHLLATTAAAHLIDKWISVQKFR